MPRLQRLHIAGGHYHVVMRGNHREPLFSSLADRHTFDCIVAESIERCRARLHAFCWMSNHVHALVQVDEAPLGGLMQRIAMRYARFRHKQLATTGHLFERRYHAWLVDTDAYFITLLRYIHWNPVKAGIVTDPCRYRWSSHSSYLGTRVLPWVTTQFGLRMFGRTRGAARSAYALYMSHAPPDSLESVLDAPHPDDARVLGDDKFVRRLAPPAVIAQPAMTLHELAAAACQEHRVPIELVRSPSRQRRLTGARVAIARRALTARVASLHEVARFLGRQPSTVSQLLSRHGE